MEERLVTRLRNDSCPRTDGESDRSRILATASAAKASAVVSSSSSFSFSSSFFSSSWTESDGGVGCFRSLFSLWYRSCVAAIKLASVSSLLEVLFLDFVRFRRALVVLLLCRDVRLWRRLGRGTTVLPCFLFRDVNDPAVLGRVVACVDAGGRVVAGRVVEAVREEAVREEAVRVAGAVRRVVAEAVRRVAGAARRVVAEAGRFVVAEAVRRVVAEAVRRVVAEAGRLMVAEVGRFEVGGGAVPTSKSSIKRSP